ncbi:hypothetical protein GCM10027176_15000 [Actinoallomurus bryophytorum]
MAGLEVVPDRGGRCRHALRDKYGDALDGACTVLFQVELAFEGVVHRFDELADLFEYRFAGSPDLVLAGGPQERDARCGQ